VLFTQTCVSCCSRAAPTTGLYDCMQAQPPPSGVASYGNHPMTAVAGLHDTCPAQWLILSSGRAGINSLQDSQCRLTATRWLAAPLRNSLHRSSMAVLRSHVSALNSSAEGCAPLAQSFVKSSQHNACMVQCRACQQLSLHMACGQLRLITACRAAVCLRRVRSETPPPPPTPAGRHSHRCKLLPLCSKQLSLVYSTRALSEHVYASTLLVRAGAA